MLQYTLDSFPYSMCHLKRDYWRPLHQTLSNWEQYWMWRWLVIKRPKDDLKVCQITIKMSAISIQYNKSSIFIFFLKWLYQNTVSYCWLPNYNYHFALKNNFWAQIWPKMTHLPQIWLSLEKWHICYLPIVNLHCIKYEENC